MNITTGQLNTVTLTMTEPEARAFLVDARATQDQVRDALAAAHSSNGNVATNSPKANLSPAAKSKKHPLAPSKRKVTTDMHVCTECGKGFKTRGRYNNHLRDAHPKTIPASPDEYAQDAQ